MQKTNLLSITLGVAMTTSMLVGNAQAGDIYANYLDSSWETQFEVTRLDSIEMWEQPKTQYTPKNLRTEQQMRFSGKNGTNSYESYTLHLTDYDTYIKDAIKGSDGNYYIQDNTGKSFLTGKDFTGDIQQLNDNVTINANNIQNLNDSVTVNANNIQQLSDNVMINTNNIQQLNDNVTANTNNIHQLNDSVTINTNNIQKLSTDVITNTNNIQQLGTSVNNNTTNINSMRTEIKNNTNNIQRNADSIKAINQTLGGMNQQISNVNSRIDKLDQKMERGFATVTALTSLHPNPRSQEKLELSIGAGMYADNCAGAIGLFYHPNDRIQIMAGGAYGGDSHFAGAVGVTFSLGGERNKK